ncbi:MAG: hypothetical protein KJ904_01615 [Alphaproteobacteria bacterium]|nr:hypothetical protein [Alphaproteobacteria bacterium]MBU0885842.1 hypothetical protein [Alphaproteobacteria bacterium]
MTHETETIAPVPAVQASDDNRKPWQTPAIEDADIASLTNGNGTSGMEGTSFLKPGS